MIESKCNPSKAYLQVCCVNYEGAYFQINMERKDNLLEANRVELKQKSPSFRGQLDIVLMLLYY